MKNKKLSTFISGVLAGLMLMACGTAAFAAGGGVSLGNLGLCINGRSFIQQGEGIKNETGETIPSSISYATETGSETLYMPIQTIAQLLDIPIHRKDNIVYLGTEPGKSTVTIVSGSSESVTTIAIDENGKVTEKTGTDIEPNSIWIEKPLHRAGTAAGRFTEIEPYWPENGQILSYSSREEERHGALALGDRYTAPIGDEGGYCSLSITNHTEIPLLLSVDCISTITRDSFPDTVVPAGETVVRTFHAEEYTGGLHQPDLSFLLRQDLSDGSRMMDISATVSMVTYDPTQVVGNFSN